MSKISFKIDGMDCAEEVAILRREIGPLVGGEANLVFDLFNRKMTVSVDDLEVDTEMIRKAIDRTGMKAVPWQDVSSPVADAGLLGLWRLHGRLIMCVASGVFLVAAFLSQAYNEGSIIDAFTSHAFPPYTLIIYIAAVICGGWFIFPKAFFALRRVRPDMNLLMAVAVIGAVAIDELFEAAAVTFLFSLALLLESWSIGRARRAVKALMELTPLTARYICPADGDIMEKSVTDVPVGATVIVRPGERIPLDGVITKGFTHVDQAPITGESLPVSKSPGDEVFAGTINGDGAFEFRSTKPASDTTLSRIIHMVEEAQSNRAPSEQWVERFARRYTPSMMVLAVLVALVPPLFLGGEWSAWFYEALVILVIACPCALVISTPVSIVAGLTAAAGSGVLIKGGAYLEGPARLRAVALDKTGTLTHGRPEVQSVIPLNRHTEDELLALAAALEIHSTHPVAGAILRKADSLGIRYRPADDFKVMQGRGAEGSIEGGRFWIGSHRFIEESGVENSAFHEMAARMEDEAHSLVVVWDERHICGIIGVADTIRDEAVEAVRGMKRQGVSRIVMLTGDNRQTAEAIASATGVDEFRAELLPEDKVAIVTELTRELSHVAMVGDGVNDAPAMAASSLGVAMGAIGTDAAIETADIALMSDDLTRLAWLIGHSRRTLGIIKQNIAFALGIKALFIVLALNGMTTLWMAIAADMGASLLVIANGLRLLRGSGKGRAEKS